MTKLSGSYLFLLLFLYPLCSIAQEKGSISGIVRETGGSPIKNALVHAIDQPYKVHTNEKGEYYLELPSNKEFVIEITRVGYSSYTITVTLKPLETKVINAKLHAREMDPFEIRETYKGQMKRIPNPGVERLPTPSGNLEDFFKSTLMGVSSNNELSSSYSVRGGNYDENLIYVNGIQIYRPFLARAGQQEGLSFLNSDLIKDLQFSAGGFEARYGDKLSSVLDIRYKEPREFGGSVTGSLMGTNIHFEGMSKNRLFTHLTGIRYRNNSYVLNSLPAKGDYKPVFADAQTLLTYHLTSEFNISVLGHYSSNNFRFVPQTRESSFGTINEALKLTVYFEGQEQTRFQTMTGAVTSNYRPTDKTHLQFTSSVFNSQESETFDVLGEYWLDELENDLGSDDFGEVAFNRGVGSFLNHARNELDATVWNIYHRGSHSFEKSILHWGAKYQMEFFDDKLSEWDFMDSAGYSIPQGAPDVVELREVLKANIHLNTWRATAYVQNTWNINKWDSVDVEDTTIYSPGILSYAIGGRVHYWDYNPQVVLSPRGHISYRPRWYYRRKEDSTIVRRSAEFRFSSGLYAQPPFYRELRGIDGVLNPEILAQKSIHAVLGADYTFEWWGRPFKLASEIYYKYLYDIIPYELDNVRLRYFAKNNGDGYATGIDFKLNGEFVKGIESWAKLSFMQTQIDLRDDYYYDYFNSDGEKIIFGYTFNDSIVDSVRHEPGYIPRPTDQRVTFGLFFQDRMPKWPSYKVQINFLFGTALPFGPPSHERYRDTLRTPPYRRVDIGFSKDLLTNKDRLKEGSFWRNIDEMWIALEVFNLLNIDNTITYTWIQDVTGRSYAIPNFLTSRRINLKLVAKF